MGKGASSEKTLLLELLDYIQELEKRKIEPAFSIPADSPFVAWQYQLHELPGLQYNLQRDGDELWLRFPRLKEIPAPEPDDELKPWIVLPKDPEKTPQIRTEITLHEDGDALTEQLDERPDIKRLFDWYCSHQWQPWASTERPRRKAIAYYNALFSLQQTIELDGADAALELVWGIGYATWKKPDVATPVKYPLLVQSCEITLNEDTFDLEIRPRDADPRLETGCYVEMDVPGVKQLEALWRSALAADAGRVNPFEPSTYEHTLKAAVGYLDSTGRYSEKTGNSALPVPDETLNITDTWVIFARKRSGAATVADIDALKAAVSTSGALPGLVQSFVKHGDSQLKVQPEQPFRGLSSSHGGWGVMDLYFPKPYNDEQVAIMQKLHANDGVVVQGPPGTGKTHTIANVICHYLAQGKRVLVTSKGESALAVLRDKLPEEVRPLSVALLANERDGMKQFAHSIQTISSNITAFNPGRTSASITAAEEKLDQLHSKIAHLDKTIREYATRHMRDDYPFQGRTMAPEDMAKLVLQQAELHQWFDDEPAPLKDGTLPFDDADIETLRRARMRVQSDLPYLGHRLPLPDNFPAWPALLELHRDLVNAKTIDVSITQGNIRALVDSRMETVEQAGELLDFLDRRMGIRTKLAAANVPWIEPLSEQFEQMYSQDVMYFEMLENILEDAQTLEDQRRELLVHALDIPEDAELDTKIVKAVNRLAEGQRAFSWPFGQRRAREVLAAITVTGFAPKSAEQWQLVKQHLDWRNEARKLLARWNGLLAEYGLPRPEAGVESGFKQIMQWKPHIDNVIHLVIVYGHDKLHGRIQDVFGNTIADQIHAGGEPLLAAIRSDLQVHVERARCTHAPKRLDEVLVKLYGCTGNITDDIRIFLKEKLGALASVESELETTWETLDLELRRLSSLRLEFDEIKRITDAICAAGATKWMVRLRTQPATSDLDPIIPASWREAWEWRQAVLLLDGIDAHQKMRHLFEDRKHLTQTLASTYQALVAEKAWLGVYRNSPDETRQALQTYSNAVHATGKGTGKKAPIYRRVARQAMERAYRAVPCWILPQMRVSEYIPAEIGLFDLVIIDEASQSEISAFPALLRGQKVLVVGDHHQVSPTEGFTAIEQLKALNHRFLDNQPFGSEMLPGKSIYDLARVVFAGNSVMLKEHFRCVPAIIEYSNREFYQNEIKPLRIPKANERLDPPLVDVFVKGGVRGEGRNSDINTAEAKAIIDEIKTLLAEPAFAGRSIGIVTLHGHDQAKYIHELLHAQIPLDEIIARRIHAGPPPIFQGQERDIMMISMVHGADNRATADKNEMRQRFNVAFSRARDRMYLFRSIQATDVSEASLNGRVLSHFKQPFRHDPIKSKTLRELCESGFEREMFDELVKRGYRVAPQVRSGGYRIDFVVEGNEGRRLAIECDGDRFHGPDQWDDDMARQRVLERAGWTFWRCFASDFVRHREEVVEGLVKTLDQLGIAPLGADSVDNTAWVAFKEVDPHGVEDIEYLSECVKS